MSFKLRKIRDSKKGLIGNFIGMFVATIAVVLILLFFILGSVFVKVMSSNSGGVSVRTEGMEGIDDIYFYMHDYAKNVKNRFENALEVTQDEK